MMRLSVAQRSERGGREYNEDFIGFCANETLGCFVLADGAGGYEGGALAAETAVRHVLSFFSAAPAVDSAAINAAIPVARNALADARERHPQYAEMDTTIAALMLDTERALAYWSHLGDSRIYLFRNGRSRILTHDHSVLQSMIDAGMFNGALRGNRKRSMLYAAVGSGEIPERAVRDKPLALLSGDIFLLCSDGFWESIGEEVMEAALQQAASPEQWLDAMVREIAEPDAADQDNYSVLAVWVGDREEITTRILAKKVQEA
ncbi:MAG: serine/threonine-protein phosphatase [Azoarcus sp.]|jgi:serine/threonine protein phosphatase PrpC|nr:serine/threonine-protein phosphatase [Azoarcus sp.]